MYFSCNKISYLSNRQTRGIASVTRKLARSRSFVLSVTLSSATVLFAVRMGVLELSLPLLLQLCHATHIHDAKYFSDSYSLTKYGILAQIELS